MVVGVVNRFFWRQGAVPSVARGWADNLEKAGHRVIVLASDVSADQSTPTRTYIPVRLGRVKWFDLGGFAFAARLLRALAAMRPGLPEAVVCTDSTAYFALWAAWRLWGLRAVLFPQGWIYSPGRAADYPRSVAWLYKATMCFCARAAPLVGCLSGEIYRGLESLGARPRRLWYAPNCVDMDRWRPQTRPPENAEPGKQLLFVGRFSPQKGLDVLLDAFAIVLEKHPDTRLRLYGGGEDDGGQYHQQARRLGITGAVEFCGLVPQEALAPVYSAADVLVMPSRSEGHALTPLECLACGTPVIASDIPGLRETVRDGLNGLLVPPGEAGPLAAAICRFIEEPGLAERLRGAARPSVRRFAWRERIAELERLCADPAANPPSPEESAPCDVS